MHKQAPTLNNPIRDSFRYSRRLARYLTVNKLELVKPVISMLGIKLVFRGHRVSRWIESEIIGGTYDDLGKYDCIIPLPIHHSITIIPLDSTPPSIYLRYMQDRLILTVRDNPGQAEVMLLDFIEHYLG